MAKSKWKNPFYTLLIPVGLVFVITGFAYGFMAFQEVNAGADKADAHAEHPLFVWLKQYGDRAILVELAILSVLTVGAIATDDWWTAEGRPNDSHSEDLAHASNSPESTEKHDD